MENNDQNESLNGFFKDWLGMHKTTKEPKPTTWTVIPELPGYEFKNLELKNITPDASDNADISEISMNFTYEDIKKPPL